MEERPIFWEEEDLVEHPLDVSTYCNSMLTEQQ